LSERVFSPQDNFEQSRAAVGYVDFAKADKEVYSRLGFKSGLEIHQQLLTAKKLFCRCPAGIFQKQGQYDAEIVRHMRPTLSEMGEYDGTALMEKRTKKNIYYHIKNETACTYDIDDTPPFLIDREALEIALEVTLLLQCNVVGELHIARKQYLDGSIPTGFQRTGILGIEGEIPISNKTVRIIQISIEEDSCREVSDIGHDRVYMTDRLGMPLIETVTYPDMVTPQEVAEAAQYLRFMTRSTGKVRTGMGAARQDVNVSIEGSTRVEIKGVAHIKWIPILTHNEAFRHKSLLMIRDELKKRIKDTDGWKVTSTDVTPDQIKGHFAPLNRAIEKKQRVALINLPHFDSLLSHFTQPTRSFADELSDRLKVIACLDRPNVVCSEQVGDPGGDEFVSTFESLKKKHGFGDQDAQLLVWGASSDIDTAIEIIHERCQMAFEGVPNETRRSRADGQTEFERVLPGPDRMYPDTDSAPLAIDEKLIEKLRANLPVPVSDRIRQLREWKVPEDTFEYLLSKNLVGMIQEIVAEGHYDGRFIGCLLGHTLKNYEGTIKPDRPFAYSKVADLIKEMARRSLNKEMAKPLLQVAYRHPAMDFDSLLVSIEYDPCDLPQLMSFIPTLKEKFSQINHSRDRHAYLSWVMGNLRSRAIGTVSLAELKAAIEKDVA